VCKRVAAAALVLALATTAAQPMHVSAHSWVVQNKCSWSYDQYFDLAGPASAWSFHFHSGDCHVDGTLIGGGTPSAWASWFLPISSSYNHTYHALANIPCASPDHRGPIVYYRMYPWGSLSTYRATYIDQRSYCSWVEVNYLAFQATQGGQARVVNSTSCPNCAGYRFVADAFQWYE
jgi:hypothetical protein